MLRAVRFAGQLGFSIEEETRQAIHKLAPNIAKVSAERIQIELVKLMSYAPNFLGVEFDQMTIPVPDSYGGMLGMEGRSLFAVDFETNSQILHDFLYENIKYEG